jgi:hypothetical protein
MRLRIGFVLAAAVATLLSPVTQLPAHAAMSYPSAPLNVGQQAITGGIRVTWTVPADVSAGLTGYQIEYSTSGTDGTWQVAGNVSAGVYTYDIIGIAANPTYVRVGSKNGASMGIYGYPWTEVYRTISPKNNINDTSINYVGGYGLDINDTASILNNTTNFSRVKYHLEATMNSVSDYADTDFYKWSGASITTLQVPVTGSTSSNFVVQTNVTDLNTYSSNSRVTNASGLTGRLEIWAWNYAPALSSDYAYGDAVRYDFNDTNNGNGAYGSFQVHDLTNSKTVFSWSYHGYDSGNNNPDIGFGNNPNTYASAGVYANPDWTFCHENNTSHGYCPNPSAFKLQIYINLAITPLVDVTPPTVLRVDSKQIAKNGDTITVQSSEIGSVYLVSQSVVVSRFESITAAASSLKNSVSISGANTGTTLTIVGLSDGLYNLYSVDTFTNLSTPVVGTIRIDNTAPTATSIAVNSAGTAIVITASETITNSMQVYGWYAINDGSSSVAVTATTFSGITATLTLARAVVSGATVTFAYSPLSGSASGRWIDAVGNEMAAITSRTITNGSGVVIAVNLSAPTTVSKGSSLTLTAVVPVAGKVSFTIAGKRIPGCLNKAATGTPPISVTCTFKGALSGRQLLTSTLVPTLNVYPTTSTTVERFFLKRSTLR